MNDLNDELEDLADRMGDVADQLDRANQLIALETNQKFNNRITIPITDATKTALQFVASRKHIAMSDLVRMAIEDFMPRFSPQYSVVYEQALRDSIPTEDYHG